MFGQNRWLRLEGTIGGLLVQPPLLKQGHPELVAQDHSQKSFEELHVWRLPSFSRQPVPVFCHILSKVSLSPTVWPPLWWKKPFWSAWNFVHTRLGPLPLVHLSCTPPRRVWFRFLCTLPRSSWSLPEPSLLKAEQILYSHLRLRCGTCCNVQWGH